MYHYIPTKSPERAGLEIIRQKNKFNLKEITQVGQGEA